MGGESNLKARQRIAKVAKAMNGAHYVNGAFGARPSGKDGADLRRNGVILEKEVGLAQLAFFTASYVIEDRNVCGGRYEAIGGSILGTEPDKILKEYLAQQTPRDPGNCFTKAGLTPRRLGGKRDKKNTNKIVWGQNCDGWRHFDCIGLVVFALQDALKKPLGGREIVQLAGPRSPYRLQKIGGVDDLLDGDMVSRVKDGQYAHIGIIYKAGSIAYVAHAAETSKGVTLGTVYDPRSWNGGCWRWPDDLLRPDAEVRDDIPDNDCKPTVSIGVPPRIQHHLSTD